MKDVYFMIYLHFYYDSQIAKLSMIPVSCLLEVAFDKIRYSRDTKLSILIVLLGVAVCTVTDVSVNTKGFVAAFIAVWSTALQQYVSIFLFKNAYLFFLFLVCYSNSTFYYSMCITFKESTSWVLSICWDILRLSRLDPCC